MDCVLSSDSVNTDEHPLCLVCSIYTRCKLPLWDSCPDSWPLQKTAHRGGKKAQDWPKTFRKYAWYLDPPLDFPHAALITESQFSSKNKGASWPTPPRNWQSVQRLGQSKSSALEAMDCRPSTENSIVLGSDTVVWLDLETAVMSVCPYFLSPYLPIRAICLTELYPLFLLQ